MTEQRVEDRGHRLDSAQAIREARGRTANRDAHREEREPERGDVRQYVERFDAEHVALGPDRARELGDEEQRRDASTTTTRRA